MPRALTVPRASGLTLKESPARAGLSLLRDELVGIVRHPPILIYGQECPNWDRGCPRTAMHRETKKARVMTN
jgi:hypothetical protein